MNEDQHLTVHLPAVVFINDHIGPFRICAVAFIDLTLKISGNSLNILISTVYDSHAELTPSAI